MAEGHRAYQPVAAPEMDGPIRQGHLHLPGSAWSGHPKAGCVGALYVRSGVTVDFTVEGESRSNERADRVRPC